MNKDNNLGRLMILLLITTFVCLAMYWLPDTVLGYKLRKVDLLADIRVKNNTTTLDSLRAMLAEPDSLVIDSVIAIKDSLKDITVPDSQLILLRDSLYRVMQTSWGKNDSLGVRIEDFSAGHTGLSRFFSALDRVKSQNRAVRVAFMGDSFIEGDIIVADLRAGLQKKFGGAGVGFVPIASNVAQFRPTITHRFSGWETYSMLSHKTENYTLPGMVFIPEEGASVFYKMENRYSNLQSVPSARLIYEQNNETSVEIVRGATDTMFVQLPFTQTITQYTIPDTITELSLRFTHTAGFRALGVAMEDTSGVVVDNFSLRGTSGMNLESLNLARCEQLNKIRPYDLIVLQYGLNVANEEVLQYGWYRQRMLQVIAHLKNCFPQADIILLGVSDRSHQEGGEFVTMPAVLALLHAQRQTAKQSGVPFWNVFAAMGGENSMVQYVNNNWASKDYTHLGFRGGKEIATSFLKAILLEKQFYDEAEKTTTR